jgi:CDP-glucose 4,6-dehydratase
VADIRDYIRLKDTINRIKPDIIFHLAAQSIVSESYRLPLETIYVNTLGTVNIMEAVRESGCETALVVVTSDKCYENKEWLHGYRETDPMGGHDPYSASKGAAEILVNSWRNSFFHQANHKVRIASVRSGNVVGGGDWTKNQLVPDCIRDLQNENPVRIRNPNATRPWQHVLEPLSGYLTLGAKLMGLSTEEATAYCEAFNFGPPVSSNRTVQEVVQKVIEHWGEGTWKHVSGDQEFHETSLLNLSFDKAYHKLRWQPKWDFEETISRTVEWYRVLFKTPYLIREFTLEQLKEYQGASIHGQTIFNNV